ncbi:MAG: DUF3999 domain-containing protein [Verrucomicrobia bacterium]|nr:DUF3999 domain-containing protein [Verrucomicrobiota bacterium]
MTTIVLAILALVAPTEWKHIQRLDVTQSGLVTVSLPPATLNAARAGLEDVRIVDHADREVPFLLLRSSRRHATAISPGKFTTSLTGRKTVVLIETGTTQSFDAITLATPSTGFIKAVSIEGSNDQHTWSLLATGQPVFRQANGVANLRVTFAEGNWRFLRATVDDARSEAVPFTGATLHALGGESATPERLPVTITDRTENGSQTRLTLDLGGANVRLASLRIETVEPLFARNVSVAVRQVQENAITEKTLARDTVYQVAIENQTPVSRLELPLDLPVATRDLLLLVENEDNPPLPVSAVTATRWPVHVVFRASQAGAYRLLTGNPRCAAPRYDLAALRQSLALTTPERPGPLAPNPSHQPAEPLPELQDLGIPLDVTPWGYRKPLQLTRPGVQQLDLDLDVLSKAEPGFRDLRLVSDGKQRPYLLERTSILRKLTPEVTPANDPKRPRVSRWQLQLPKPNLPVTRLTCSSPTPLFRRHALLHEEPVDRRGDTYRRQLGSASWVRTSPASKPTLELSLSQAPLTGTMFLETDNGDNPAIELSGFALFYPVTRALFKAPMEPSTWLYFGNREASYPQYDLDLIAPQLLAEEKLSATLGELETLKKTGWAASQEHSRTGHWLFWGALAVVVLILIAVITRLLPKAS